MLRAVVFSSVVALLGLMWPSAAHPVSAQATQDGEALARRWCASCHSFPEPSLLDRRTWLGTVLPDMGLRLGLESFRGRTRPRSDEIPAGLYPPEPLVAEDDFEAIVAWYEAEAPERLDAPEWQPRTGLALFDVEAPDREEVYFPTGTAVFIDEAARRLLAGDAFEMDLDIFDADLEPVAEIPLAAAVSRIARRASGSYLATTMGETIGPTEAAHGRLVEIADGRAAVPLIRRLQRPVDFAHGDFNGDGETDYITAGYGHHSGALTLHPGGAGGAARPTVLLNEAGAISVAVVGEDLLALMAQGNERIVRIKDFAGAHPATETVMRFPPAQGSTSMRVLDFNGDGREDLLYTAGDNADTSPIFKPYHGVYLFTGRADGSFRQEMFFPFDGAYGAAAEDFDGDGDTDIAAVSYFPNLARGLDEGAFVYLENSGGGFRPRFVEGIGELGRFIAIASGDLDGDGDKDIALASLAFGPKGPSQITPDLQQRWIHSTHLVVLRNRLRQN